MILKTERLVLRGWAESDAQAAYLHAKDPSIGPNAGWPMHTSVENSRQIIRDVLMADETYAVVLKNEAQPIGSVGLLIGEKSTLDLEWNEGEIGYWLGRAYWGKGIIPEAVNALLRHGFKDCGLLCIWCGYFDGNEQSRRVAQKCGFLYHHTKKEQAFPLINATKTQHITCITKKQYDNCM